MPIGPHAEALAATLALARQLTNASMTVALVQRTQGEVMALRSEPQLGPAQAPVWHWQLSSTSMALGESLQPMPLNQLPSLITAGLPFTPAAAAYLDCTEWADQVTGGVMFLWDKPQAYHAAAWVGIRLAESDPVLLLRPIYARLLDDRQLAAQTLESVAQFHDIFDSVPHGIVVVAGQGTSAQVNQCAADLLRIAPGAVPVEVSAQAMREARLHCDNATELEEVYRPLQYSMDAEVAADWQLEDRVWRVNTRPILSSGLNGRVWLFHDITAQVRLERVLRLEATHDPLTGLFNRRAFFERAHARYQAQSPTAGHALALLLFDIDHFKRVNDSYGHPAGDKVLKEVAQRLPSLLRDGDLLARYGGEEFVLLIGPTTLANARSAGERLRLAVASQPIVVGEQSIPVQISGGLTLRLDSTETLAQTLERTDSLLYQAKREGRNRVVAG